MEVQTAQKKVKSVVNPGKKPSGRLYEGQHANVQSILHANRILPKLRVGQPNDKYEQEADRVADQVMRMPEPKTQQTSQADANHGGIKSGLPASNANVPIQRQEEDEELIQAKSTGEVTPAVTPAISAGIQSLQGGGRPLSRSDRSFFEPRFGADFSAVRVHSDTRAAEAARIVNARAFTVGRDVVFGAGQYAPWTTVGKRLLAHELTHVVQQQAMARPEAGRLFRQTYELTTGKVRNPLVRLGNFRNRGPVSSENNCRICSHIPHLGVHESSSYNYMELRGDIPSQLNVEYDFKRIAEAKWWKFNRFSESWEEIRHKPPFHDDITEGDEYLTPVNNHIYVVDGPGPDNLKAPTVDYAANQYVIKYNFVEWINASFKPEFTKWTGVKVSNEFEWHSINWFEPVDEFNVEGLWKRKEGWSEIAPGQISLEMGGL
jgi:uncharacterized protein DUF4157